MWKFNIILTVLDYEIRYIYFRPFVEFSLSLIRY